MTCCYFASGHKLVMLSVFKNDYSSSVGFHMYIFQISYTIWIDRMQERLYILTFETGQFLFLAIWDFLILH
jgi:hypothetical protein